MTRDTFRLIIAVAVITIHATCFAIIMYWKDPWLSPSQQIDLALLLIPVPAAWVAAIIRAVLAQKEVDGQRLARNYVVIVSLFSSITLIGLLFTTIRITDLDLARKQILLLEIAFGSIFGTIVADLFGRVEQLKPQLEESNPEKS